MRASRTVQTRKIVGILKKGLLYTSIAAVGLFLPVALYQILKVLLVAAILLIAFLSPKRWWR
jgi:hypothetical protein